MATTSIWRVKGWLGKVLIYVENPDKTENPAAFEKQGMDGQEAQGLSDVIEYAARQEKTGRIAPDEEGAPVMQRFVSGVNCSSSTARDEMMAVKKRFGRKFYSFSTKYCSHHKPLDYPIYDSYVEKVLCYFRDRDGFDKFKTLELKDYEKFIGILIEFRSFYGLDRYNLKEIDKYMWQLGREYFPKNYGKKKT